MDSINIAVWLAIGAVIGFLAQQIKRSPDRIVQLETMAVAVFGAFVGGEPVAIVMRGHPKDTSVSLVAVALAIACSVAAVVLLALMRRVVGPLRPSKPKRR